jgi:hypothetical protein
MVGDMSDHHHGYIQGKDDYLNGGDLGEDVDAVLLLLDHALEAARLALDALEPLGPSPG